MILIGVVLFNVLIVVAAVVGTYLSLVYLPPITPNADFFRSSHFDIPVVNTYRTPTRPDRPSNYTTTAKTTSTEATLTEATSS